MKNKEKLISLFLIVLFIISLTKLCEHVIIKEDKEIAERVGQPVKKKDLIINTNQPNITGKIVIESNGIVTFSYEGDIQIINDGKNGKPIDIYVNANGENKHE